jgi:hypothetical protein
VRSSFNFWEEHQECPVNPRKVDSTLVEGVEKLTDIRSHGGPESGEEGRAKAIRARARELVHGHESCLNLGFGERVTVVRGEARGIRVEVLQAEVPSRRSHSAKKVEVEVFEDGSFAVVVS